MQLFLSDLHLDSTDSPAFTTLCSLLEHERKRCRQIYFLGDLVEVWIGDDDDGPLAAALTGLLSETSRHCEIFLMHGNRDFLFGQAFAQRTGVKVVNDPMQLDDNTLLAHGDAFCTDDLEYQKLRSTLRSPAWQQQILATTLPERRKLAAGMRSESRSANANKPDNIMDVTIADIDQLMRELGRSVLIHGHTHRPGVHQHSWGQRFVLGAWERCGWLVRRSSAGCQLECFALRAHS